MQTWEESCSTSYTQDHKTHTYGSTQLNNQQCSTQSYGQAIQNVTIKMDNKQNTTVNTILTKYFQPLSISKTKKILTTLQEELNEFISETDSLNIAESAHTPQKTNPIKHYVTNANNIVNLNGLDTEVTYTTPSDTLAESPFNLIPQAAEWPQKRLSKVKPKIQYVNLLKTVEIINN